MNDDNLQRGAGVSPPMSAPARPSATTGGCALSGEAELTAVDAAELRAAELALANEHDRPLTLAFGKRLDRFIADALIEHTKDHPPADPFQVMETLLRISAGIAIVRDRDALWFQSYARGIYDEERQARSPYPKSPNPNIGLEGTAPRSFRARKSRRWNGYTTSASSGQRAAILASSRTWKHFRIRR